MGASSDRLLKWKSRDVYPRLKSVRKLRYENCSVERTFTLGWLNFSVTPTSDGDGPVSWNSEIWISVGEQSTKPR